MESKERYLAIFDQAISNEYFPHTFSRPITPKEIERMVNIINKKFSAIQVSQSDALQDKKTTFHKKFQALSKVYFDPVTNEIVFCNFLIVREKCLKRVLLRKSPAESCEINRVASDNLNK